MIAFMLFQRHIYTELPDKTDEDGDVAQKFYIEFGGKIFQYMTQVLFVVVLPIKEDFLTNFSPSWNFNPAHGAEILLLTITSRTWARAEIISLGAKYEIAREESQENQNGAENTNRENRRVASLAVWCFGNAQFSTFLDGNSLQDDGTEAKTVFGCISLS